MAKYLKVFSQKDVEILSILIEQEIGARLQVYIPTIRYNTILSIETQTLQNEQIVKLVAMLSGMGYVDTMGKALFKNPKVHNRRISLIKLIYE